MTPIRIVVMGVSGCGKSTVGLALAQRRGVPFLEGDGLHPPSNIAAMAAGIALDDAMRQPWLQSIADRIHDESNGVVASCSALRRTYRDVLRQKGPVFFVYLAIDIGQTLSRMQARPAHFMNPALAASQHASLEPLLEDEWGVTVKATRSVRLIIDHVCGVLDKP
jgi:gluconokinase